MIIVVYRDGVVTQLCVTGARDQIGHILKAGLAEEEAGGGDRRPGGQEDERHHCRCEHLCV